MTRPGGRVTSADDPGSRGCHERTRYCPGGRSSNRTVRPARVRADAPDLLDFVAAAQVCQAVRRSGSAALNLAYVACGWLDAFWATHIHPWDVAAGVLLVREAGGVVSGRGGGEFDLWKPHFMAAATGALQRAILATHHEVRRSRHGFHVVLGRPVPIESQRLGDPLAIPRRRSRRCA